MKKIILATSAALLLATSVSAVEPSEIIDYAGAGLASQNLDGWSGVAIALKAGKKLDFVLPNFGVEAELTRAVAGDTSDWDTMTIGAYATYNFEIDSKIYVMPKAGFARISTNVYGYSDSSIEVALGVTGGYNFKDNIDLNVELTIIDELTNITFGARFNF